MNIIVVHGSYSQDDKWFTTFDSELSSYGCNVLRPNFPQESFNEVNELGEEGVKNKTDWQQTLNNWLDYFEQEVLPHCDETSIFIAHSLGPVFTLHALNKFRVKIKAGIFVAPFHERLPNTSWQFEAVNRTFFPAEFDSANLRNLIPFSYVLYSTNDPYVPSESSLKFAQLLDSTVIPVVDGHHLGGKFGRLLLVEELAKTIIGYASATDTQYILK